MQWLCLNVSRCVNPQATGDVTMINAVAYLLISSLMAPSLSKPFISLSFSVFSWKAPSDNGLNSAKLLTAAFGSLCFVVAEFCADLELNNYVYLFNWFDFLVKSIKSSLLGWFWLDILWTCFTRLDEHTREYCYVRHSFEIKRKFSHFTIINYDYA